MGIEKRNGKSYYYKKERKGDRVVSRYVGRADDLIPKLMAGLVEARRLRPGLEAASAAAASAESDALHVEAGRVAAEARGLAGLAMGAAGYHQHARGPWRRRRMPGVNIYGPGMLPPAGPELDAFQDRARSGDEATRPAFANLFLSFPETADQPQSGDVAGDVEDRMIRHHAGKNIVKQEGIRAKLQALRSELAGPEPTPIERLLAGRAAFLWLAAHAAEADALKAEGPATARADRRCVTAHNRYVATLKALATVRRLALPDLKVHIDGRTVNVSQTPPPAPGMIEAQAKGAAGDPADPRI